MGGTAPAPAGQIILPKDTWIKVLEWGGITLSIISYKFTAQEQFRSWPIQWRRYGAGVPPYWEGEFRGSENFHIYPTDLYLRVDLKTSLALGVNIETSDDK